MNDIATQYRTIVDEADGLGWIERTDRGRLRFDGADRVSFLHALVTNEVAALAPGAGTLALYLTPQGRTIADLGIFVLPDGVLADVPASVATKLASLLDSLIFAEDVRVSDVSAALRQISAAGAKATRLLARLAGTTEDALKSLPVWSHVPLQNGIMARTDRFDIDSWDVLVDQAGMPAVIAALEREGAIHLREEVAEILRIEAGRPKFGVDFAEDTIPLEAGLLDRAISRTKGCYVGQEVIIRVLDRGAGRVAKRLVRLSISAERALPPAHARLLADDRDVGQLTSVAMSPKAGAGVALGYVIRDVAEVDRVVTVSSPDGTATARVTGFAA